MPALIYVQPETDINWRASGGDLALTLTSLGAGNGRQGAAKDFGAGVARSRLFRWRFFMKFADTPVLNEAIYIYIKEGDGTHRDNDDGTGDIALSHTDKLKNLKRIGVLTVDEQASAPEFSASGEFSTSAREVFPVIHNATADAFSSTAADHGFDLTPMPDEIQ